MMRAWRESFQKIDAKGKWENTTKARKKHVCAWLRLRATGMPGGACAQAASCFLLPRYDEVGRCSGVVRELDYRLSTTVCIESAFVPDVGRRRNIVFDN
jgi:hypothetical protein